jgi:hypothetical protein
MSGEVFWISRCVSTGDGSHVAVHLPPATGWVFANSNPTWR